MDEFEQRIVELAEIYKPDEFIQVLEDISVPQDKKGDFFLEIGIILYRFSYFRLALNSWNHTLEYYLEIRDRSGESKCYTNLGIAYHSLGDFRKAIEYHEKSLKIMKEIGDRHEESKCFTNLGAAYRNLGDFRKAIEYHEKSLKIMKEIGDRYGKSKCYGNLGNAYLSLGDFRKAIEYHEKSLKIDREIGDRSGEATCYTNLGIAYNDLGDFRKAIEYHEKSLKIMKEIGDRYGKSKCFTNLGAAYRNLGDFRKAIEYHEKSLKIMKEIGDRHEESKCFTNLGIAYHSLGDFRKAIEYHEKSLEIDREVGDRSGEATCYTNLGIAYHSLGDFRKAIEYHEKSLKIMKEIGDRYGESKCFTNLGAAYLSLGDFRKAIEYHEKSLEIDREIGDRSGEATCYGSLGIAYRNLGDFRKAIEYYEKSLEIMKEIGDRHGESKCFTNLGAAYLSLGDFRKAIEYHKKSLEIDREVGDRSEESKCYTNLGITYDSLGDFKKAIEYYEKSLKIVKEIGDRSGESACYGNLGIVYYKLGDLKKTIEYYEKSLEIVKEIGDRSGESACYGNLGLAYDSLGDFKKAIEYYEKSLKIVKEIGDINSERIVNLNLCQIYYESEKELAYKYCEHSIELSEMISGRLVEEEKRIMFTTQTFGAYHYMIPLCLNLKREKEAFNYTERSKSRAFLDLLAATEIKPTVGLTENLKSLLHNEQIYLDKWREIQTQHLRQTKISVELGEIDAIRDKLDQIYDQIENYDAEYVYARRGRPFSLDSIQDMFSSQKRDVILIEYFITENKVIIFVISSKDNKFHIKTVPLSQEGLNKYIENYPKKMAVYSYFQHIDKTLLELGKYLIDPVSDYLTKGDLIYFVPYGPLHYIPLHAVELRGEPLIKRHPIVYAPSASIIKFCQKKGSNTLKSCASFGVDPYGRIKDTVEKEAEKVAGLFNGTSYTDFQATKSTVLKKCVDKDVIHFACHGTFDNADPLSSGVVLYDKVVLSAREIFDMRLTTELVTLSACQTGMNERSPGDELIGLTRAFLYAGAPSIIVSLWLVDNPSTYELMLEFYSQLKKGADKATALQMAQIKIMEKREYTHPYYWAPFVLVGDWQ